MIIKPEEAGFSPERLERITHHIENRYMQAGKVAGCQVLVARHGHVAYYRSFGLRDRERELPMSDDTIFRIYSMTKPIASVALMQLFEQGHFQLSDPVARFIPAWADLEVYSSGDKDDMKTEPCARPMSVRDALMHMTGLASGGDPTHPVDAAYRESRSDPDNPGMLRMRRGATLQTLVDGLASMPLKFQPGTRWSYGLSTDICGYLVEVMSGKPFDRYLADHVFGPLGMPDTGFHIPAEKVGRFAANYGRRRDKSLALFDDPEKSAYLRPPTYFSGAGGLCSTTADYLRFCQMLLNGGELDGERVLGRKTIALMARNHIPGGQDLAAVAMGAFGETAFDGVGFGLGFAVTLGEVETQTIGSVGEYYWGGAASTIFWNDPVEDLCAIFMTQLMPSGTFNFRGQLKNLIYPAIVD